MKNRLGWLLALPLLAACAGTGAVGAPPAVETGVSAEAWAAIPAGSFPAGAHDTPTPLDYAYEMMVTDVTNAQYARFLTEAVAAGAVRLADGQVTGAYPGDVFRAVKHEKEIPAGDYRLLALGDPSQHVRLDNGAFGVEPGWEQHPVVMVTWFGARAYCAYYQWRLPTELEWEKAARGPEGRVFPWGAEAEPAYANYYHSGDPFEPLGMAGRDTTPVGFFNGQSYSGFQTQDAASPFGLYDMAGNVWQWTADVYPGQHYRYLRGGSKDAYAYNLRAWTRNSAEPDYASPGVGFRCAR